MKNERRENKMKGAAESYQKADGAGLAAHIDYRCTSRFKQTH